MGPGDPVREFIRSFNEGDLDAFVATLHPEVEIHAARGLRKGIAAAQEWGTRAPGGVQQQIRIDELYESNREELALAMVTRLWHWDEDGAAAGEDRLAWLFELRDGRVLSWRAFEERAQAIAAAGERGLAIPPGGH
jgi:ketosteroid isomerase-like protein